MPSAGECDNKNKAGWNEYVSECRQQALFWHNMWRANGSPRHGVIADIWRNTRVRYHYALRYIDRNKNRLHTDKMDEAIASSHSRDLWSEIKKVRCKS